MEQIKQEPKKEQATTVTSSVAKYDLGNIKIGEDGNADCNFAFGSKDHMHKICLFPEIKEVTAAKNVVTHASAVIVRFEAGRFILDDDFRSRYYNDVRKLNDIKVLKRLCDESIGYGSSHWFISTVSNEEAKRAREEVSRVFGIKSNKDSSDPLTRLINSV